MASYQPADLTDIIASLTPRPEHVVVRLYLPGERPSQQHSLDQIASARANGCTVGGYVWAYPDFDPRQTVQDGLALAERAGLRLPVLWIDVETYEGKPGPGVDWLRAAAEACQARGVQAGIYTAKWYVDAFLPEAVELANLPLWVAQYDGRPTLSDFEGLDGWAHAAGKQYRGEGIDLDVFREEYTILR